MGLVLISLCIIVIICLFVYYKYEDVMNRINKASNNEQMIALAKNYLNSLHRIAGAKNKHNIYDMVELLRNTYIFKSEIVEGEDGVLKEYELYIDCDEAQIPDIKKTVSEFINMTNMTDLLIWIYPDRNDVISFEEVRSFHNESGAYVAKEMLRRFLNVISYVVKVNYSGQFFDEDYSDWALVVAPEYNSKEIREKYNLNFNEWIKELHKIDPNIRKHKPQKPKTY